MCYCYWTSSLVGCACVRSSLVFVRETAVLRYTALILTTCCYLLLGPPFLRITVPLTYLPLFFLPFLLLPGLLTCYVHSDSSSAFYLYTWFKTYPLIVYLYICY